MCDESAARVHGIGDLRWPRAQFIRAQRGRPQLTHTYSRAQQLRRHVTVPRPLTPPEPGWEAAYDKAMAKMVGIETAYATWE